MDVELKKKVNSAVEAAVAESKNRVPYGTEPVPYGTGTESKTLTRWMRGFVRNRLRKEGIWGKAQSAFANDGLDQIFARKLRPSTRPVEEKQYAFPGFELPEKIRMGKSSVNLPETRMSRFLVFVDGFQARSQQDQQKAVELLRLAEKVRPFADGDPTVAEAFRRADSQPVTLMVVPRLG